MEPSTIIITGAVILGIVSILAIIAAIALHKTLTFTYCDKCNQEKKNGS